MCSWPATLRYLVLANDYDEFTSWELIYSRATGRICELASCGAGLRGAARMCSWPATLEYLVSANDYDEFISWELIYRTPSRRIFEEPASRRAGIPGPLGRSCAVRAGRGARSRAFLACRSGLQQPQWSVLRSWRKSPQIILRSAIFLIRKGA